MQGYAAMDASQSGGDDAKIKTAGDRKMERIFLRWILLGFGIGLSLFFGDRILLSLPIDPPVCYLETPDGTIRNLESLCRSQPNAPSNSLSCPRQNPAIAVQICNVNYDGNSLSGSVTNHSDRRVKNVKVNYQVLDAAGNLIDNGYIAVSESAIAPGASAQFHGIIMAGEMVETTYAEWSN